MAEQRVDDPPAAARLVLEDARVTEQLQDAIADSRLDPARQGVAGRHRPRDEEPVLVEQPDPFHNLLHRRAVALDRPLGEAMHPQGKHLVVSEDDAEVAAGISGFTLQSHHEIDRADPVGSSIHQVT